MAVRIANEKAFQSEEEGIDWGGADWTAFHMTEEATSPYWPGISNSLLYANRRLWKYEMGLNRVENEMALVFVGDALTTNCGTDWAPLP